MANSSKHDSDLGARIAEAQEKHAAKTAPRRRSNAASGYGLGMKMVMDLVGGALVGLVFGLAFDHVLGTEPWGLLVLLMLGMGSGFRLMLRTAESHAKRSTEDLKAEEELRRSNSAKEGQEKP